MSRYNVGWWGLDTFLENSTDSVLLGLKETSQDFDHELIACRSSLSLTADVDGFSTIMYRLVSSAKSLNLDCISSTMSFM